jgi:hypothetical protein
MSDSVPSEQIFIGNSLTLPISFDWSEDLYGQNNRDWKATVEYWSEHSSGTQSFRLKGSLEYVAQDGPSELTQDEALTFYVAMGDTQETLWLFNSQNTIQSGYEPRSIFDTHSDNADSNR